MKVLLAEPRGFCAGVRMAIDVVEQALQIVGPPLYVYHEIVHNRHVVEDFEKRGVVFLNDLSEAPAGGVVVFSAHGVSPEVRAAARKRGCAAIDATCPLVTKVHLEAVRFARQGFRILLIGHRGHDEVVGTVGEAPDAIAIVESPEDVARLPFPPEEKLAYLTQTTLSTDDAGAIIDAIKKRYPHAQSPPAEDICYATTNRQEAVRALAAEADLTLVIGSKNSSNSVRLTEIARNAGCPARLVDDVSEIDPAWMENVQTLALTAGASAPEPLVEEILEFLKTRFGAEAETRSLGEENVYFSPPKSLKMLKKGLK